MSKAMKTIYVAGSRRRKVDSSDMEIPIGKHFQVILSNDPVVIDSLIRNSIDIVPPDTLVALHSKHVTWVAYAIESITYKPGITGVNYVCRHCHQPVEAYHTERREDGEVRHHRYLCRCTMLLLPPEMMPWWRELGRPDMMWNETIVLGAKRAHKQHGIK